MSAHLPAFLVLIFFLGALLMPLAVLVSKRLPWLLAVLTTGGATMLAVVLLRKVLEEGPMRYAMGGWQPPVGIELVSDPLAVFISLVIAAVGTFVLFHSSSSVKREMGGEGATYYASALLALGGFIGIVNTGDLFNLYVFLEISSLASYALLGCGGRRSAVAAFRYLILGTIGASFYLIGIGFIFVQTGSLNMIDVAAILAATPTLDPAVALGIGFIVVGMGLKMALLPLHQWLPDAYTYAPNASTALIAPVGTKVAAYVLIRLLIDVFPAAAEALHLRDIIGVLGAVGIIWGSIMAIPQRNIKRMLAYSSVAQIGYIALGLGLGTAYGYVGAILHILAHACMKAALFLIASNFEARGYGLDIDKLKGVLRREMPLTSAAFAVAAISMIGLPPTAGFFSKWYLLLGSFEEGRWIFIAVILVSSLLNAVYFFRVLERIYLGPIEEPPPTPDAPDNTFRFTFSPAVLSFGLVVLGLSSVLIVTHVILPMLPVAP